MSLACMMLVEYDFNGEPKSSWAVPDELTPALANAAPDLYEALQLVLVSDLVTNDDHDPMTCVAPSCSMARRVLAKARGERT